MSGVIELAGAAMIRHSEPTANLTDGLALAQPNLGFPQHSDNLFWCLTLPAHLHLLQEL